VTVIFEATSVCVCVCICVYLCVFETKQGTKQTMLLIDIFLPPFPSHLFTSSSKHAAALKLQSVRWNSIRTNSFPDHMNSDCPDDNLSTRGHSRS